MLARRWRLTRDRDFQIAYRRGRRLRGVSYVLVVYPVIPPATSKFAVVVSGRVAKQATRRNQLRRRTWAALRSAEGALPRTPYHFVWLVQPRALRASYQDLAHEVVRLLGSLNQMHV